MSSPVHEEGRRLFAAALTSWAMEN